MTHHVLDLMVTATLHRMSVSKNLVNNTSQGLGTIDHKKQLLLRINTTLYYIMEQFNAHCRILSTALARPSMFISFSIYSHGGNDMVLGEYHPIQVNHQQLQVFQPFSHSCFNPSALASMNPKSGINNGVWSDVRTKVLNYVCVQMVT
jgi:hypothetical protein